MAKQLTREQATRKKEQAAAFMDRIGESDRADEFRDMSVDDYADGKGVRLSNSRFRKRSMNMAKVTSRRDDLQDQLDRAIETLEDAYQPETDREALAEAVGKALEILKGEDEEADDDDADEDDDDQD